MTTYIYVGSTIVDMYGRKVQLNTRIFTSRLMPRGVSISHSWTEGGVDLFWRIVRGLAPVIIK
jgi:hypothetical protein